MKKILKNSLIIAGVYTLVLLAAYTMTMRVEKLESSEDIIYQNDNIVLNVK